MRLGAACVVFGLLAGCTSSNDDTTTGTDLTTATTNVSDTATVDGGNATTSPAPGAAVRDDRPVTDASGSGYEFSRLAMGAGGWVTGLVSHPAEHDVMFARTDVGGAYRWDAATQSWVQMITATSFDDPDRSNADYVVESVAVAAGDPDVVYLSVGNDDEGDPDRDFATDGRVLRSTDGGATWEASTTEFFVAGNSAFRQQGERLAVDPLDPDVVVLGTRREGLWRSTDGGDTFDEVAGATFLADDEAAVDFAGVTFVTPDPAGGTTPDGLTARWYVGVAGVGVLRSDDGAETWDVVRAIDASQVPQEGQVVDGRLHVAFNDPGGVPGSVEVYDGEWVDISPRPEVNQWSVAADPTDPDRILVVLEAVNDNNTFLSDDGGSTWTNLTVSTGSDDIGWVAVSNDGGYMPIGRLVFDPHDPGRIWFAEGIGVWSGRIDGSGEIAWNFAGAGIDELVVADFVAPPGGDVVSAVADFQGFLHDDPSAYPATPLVDGDFAGSTSIDDVGGMPDHLVWTGAEYHVYFNPERRARAARSSDGGRTWEEIPNLVPEMFGGTIAASAGDPDNLVWVPSYYLSPFEYEDMAKGVFVTTDGGDSWTNLPDVGGTNRFHRLFWWFARRPLAADEVEPGTFYLFDDEEHFWVTRDGGLEWEQSEFGPPCTVDGDCHVVGQLHADPFTTGVVWAAVGTEGLHRTDDAGSTPWQRIDGIDEVTTMGFGAPVAPSTEPAIYFHGRANGDPEPGVWRTVDSGRTIELVSRTPLDSFAGINVVEGDMARPGRVYVGFGGTGAAYGDDPSLGDP